MPYPYALPTTSPILFDVHYTSPVYPTLPILLSQKRGSLRNLLKAHKRLPAASKAAQLPQLLASLEAYLPYLLFLQQSLHSGDVLPSDVDPQPFKASWRSTLTSSPFPGAEKRRIDREGLEFEVGFVLSTIAYIHTLLARTRIQEGLAPRVTAERKNSLLNTAIQHLLTSNSVFSYSMSLPRAPTPETPFPLDLTHTVLSALASLSLADASLFAVTKQDPYPSYLAFTSMNDASKSKEPSKYLCAPVSTPRAAKALLLSRICIAASSHAENALGLLSSCRQRRIKLSAKSSGEESLVPELVRYLENLQKVARAKACRFLGVDAEASGRVGEGIGWIILARDIMGTSSRTSTSSKIRRELKERKAINSGDGTWGLDGGMNEEAQVLKELEKNWRASNDIIYFQMITASPELAAKIPSGREVHTIKPWDPEKLDAETIRGLRGSILEGDMLQDGWAEEDSEEEVVKDRNMPAAPSSGASVGGYY